MNSRIGIPDEEVAAFCQRWQVTELALFGSVLRNDFRPDSDVDMLVQFDPVARPTLFDMVRMREESQGILGRDVDLVSRRGIERSRNYIRTKNILGSTEVIYGA